MGGTLIFRVKEDDPTSVYPGNPDQYGQQPSWPRRYIPEIVDGDKRILVINGEAVPYCLAASTPGRRSSGQSGSRWNRPGSAPDATGTVDCRAGGPFLRERGLLFVGLDVIGDYLTEINVTSPTCIREIDAAYDLDIGGQLMDCISRGTRKTELDFHRQCITLRLLKAEHTRLSQCGAALPLVAM